MAKPEKAVTIKAVVGFFDSPLWGYHIIIPKKKADRFVEGKDRRIVVVINDLITLNCALMPGIPDSWYVLLNKTNRKKLRVDEGDFVSLSITKDRSVYGHPVPEELSELLIQDTEGEKLFHALTKGLQRSLIYYIIQVKSPALRLNRCLAIFKNIKKNKGKVDFKEIMEDIKTMHKP